MSNDAKSYTSHRHEIRGAEYELRVFPTPGTISYELLKDGKQIKERGSAQADESEEQLIRRVFDMLEERGPGNRFIRD